MEYHMATVRHREKTFNADIKTIADTRRVTRGGEDHDARIERAPSTTKCDTRRDTEKDKSRWNDERTRNTNSTHLASQLAPGHPLGPVCRESSQRRPRWVTVRWPVCKTSAKGRNEKSARVRIARRPNAV